ncbi:hypothetical protein SLS62_001328 [Diatrype stigma]|uniref:Uncharacterized protein n=1 Tax=Diatrype stigma TaxID=117547 RepID=A0AAN9V8G8_9PEZI
MKFAAAVLFAAAASAADVLFKVSDFSADCIPHSSQCRVCLLRRSHRFESDFGTNTIAPHSYSFGVIQAGNGETTPVQCTQLVTSDGTLPEVKDAACENSSRTFSVAKAADGLTFSVSQRVTPSSVQTGNHQIPSAELTTTEQGTAKVQSYTGAKDFDLVSA